MNARIEVSFSKSDEAEIAARAISVDNRPQTRSSADISTEDCRLVLDIQATDLGALRAAINSYLREIKIADAVLSV
jgi:tRNA threonylcarbamoyladenosine modification (KEOPS) complex  Pcc1 subunit